MHARGKSLAFVVIVLLATTAAWAYDPPAGAETVAALAAPELTSGGLSAASTDSPMADLANPAASALLQRTTMDLSYAALVGLVGETGWGNAVNFGLAVPKPYGVWTGHLGVLQSPFASMPLGTIVNGRIGIA